MIDKNDRLEAYAEKRCFPSRAIYIGWKWCLGGFSALEILRHYQADNGKIARKLEQCLGTFRVSVNGAGVPKVSFSWCYPKSLLNLRGSVLRTLLPEGIDVGVTAPDLPDGSLIRHRIEYLGVQMHETPIERREMNPLADFTMV